MQWLFDIRYFTSILQYRCISIEPMPRLHAVFKIVTIICTVVMQPNLFQFSVALLLIVFNQIFNHVEWTKTCVL